MAVEKTVELKIDAKEALKRLEAVENQLEDISESIKKNEKNTNSLAEGFKGIGGAMKAAGFGLIMKLVDGVTDALMKNQQIADAVNTVFNSIGIVFKMVSDTLVKVATEVFSATDNFDAMQKVVTNLMTLAITPFKLAFDGIKLGIQKLQLVWEKSMFGGKGKDIERINELTASIEKTKESLKETATEAVDAGKTIATNFAEAVGEVANIATKTTEAFKETFEGVTVTSIIEQGKAITETKKNYELLALEQQRLVEQYDIEAETQRQIRDDVRLSIDERIAANNELAAVLQKQTDAEKAAVQAQIDALTELEELEGKTNETKAQRFELETELLAIDAKVKGFQAEQLTNEAALQDEKIANIQELSSIGKTALDQEINDIEIQAEQKRTLAQRSISDQKELQRVLLKIDDDANKKKKKIQKKADKDELKIQQAQIKAKKAAAIDAGKSLLAGIGTLAGEGTKVGKAAAIAQILIDTASGISSAISGASSAGAATGPAAPITTPLLIAQLVGTVLAGVGQAKAILGKVKEGPALPSTDVNLGGGGGDDFSALDDAREEEEERFAELGETDTGPTGLGSLIPNIQAVTTATQPIQAYVVENDISSSQALQEELEVQATL